MFRILLPHLKSDGKNQVFYVLSYIPSEYAWNK